MCAFKVRHAMAHRVAQQQRFERDARAELQRARAQPPDAARRDVDRPRAVVVDSQLGVEWAVPQAERAGGGGRGASHLLLPVGRQPRRRHIDRLLEEGAHEGVGLVEDRQHLELASVSRPSTETSTPGM